MIKTFSVNWDSIPELEKILNQAKSRIGELRISQLGNESRKSRFGRVFDSCVDIWNADISAVYRDVSMCEDTKFYVYAHMDMSRRIAVNKHPITSFAASLGMSHFPFYIGKGTGDRFSDITRSETHKKICQKLKMLGMEPKPIKIKDGLTEKEALQYESKLIDIFGLVPHGGTLANLDEGYRPNERRLIYNEHFSSLSIFNKDVIVPKIG